MTWQMNYLGRLTLLTILFGSFLLGCTSSEKSGNETPLEPIVLQLKWTHQFQFAGYYAALEQGFFKEEGLDVTIVAGGPSINVDDEVLSGRATYGVLASELVKKWQDNKPVVLIAPIIQHSIRALMVREDSEIFSPHDLIGKRVVVTVNEDPEIKTMFLNEGITPEMVDFEPQNATSEARFLNGEVDAVVGSIANQPYQFKLKGVKVRTIRPINYGVDFYGDSLFTSQQEARAHPQRVEAFLRAVVRGWDYAFENQDETIALIRTQYAPEKTAEQLTFEAQTLYSLTLPDLVEIGHNNPERWNRIVDTYVGVGLMEPVTSLEDFFYAPLSAINYTWLRWLGGGLGFALVILAVILVWNAQLQQMVRMRTNALEKQFEELQQTEQALRQSESLLHRSQEQAGLGSFTWELQNDSLAWSRNMFAIHGFNQDTFSGNLSEVSNQLIHPDDRARAQTEIEKMVIAKQVWPMEFRVIRSDGVERIMQSSGVFEFDTQLQPVRCIGIHQDITERKRAEEKIERHNQRLKVLREIDLAILTADSVENIVGAALNHVLELINCQRAALALIDWDIRETVVFGIRSTAETSVQKGTRIPLTLFPDPMFQTLLMSEPFVINDFTVLADLPPLFQSFFNDGLRSICILPLIAQGKLIGTFNLSSRVIGFFDEDKTILGREVANQVAIALAQSQLFEDLRESEEKYHAFFQNSLDAILLMSPDGSITAANPAACKMFGRTEAEIFALGRAGLVDMNDPRLLILLEERIKMGKAYGEMTMLRNDGSPFNAEMSSATFQDKLGNIRTSIIIRDTTERKQAEEKIRRQINYLTALQDIDRAIVTAFDMHPNLNTLISKAVSLLAVDAARVLLINSSMDSLEFAAGDGFRTDATGKAKLKIGESYAGRVVLEHRIVKIPDLKNEADNPFLTGLIKEEGFASYHGAPLIVEGKVIGVFEVFHRSLVKRDQEWLDFLNALAGQAAVAISNAQLFEHLQQSNKDLLQAYDATIEGWSRAMDLRDKETEGHTLRVTEMNLRLARLLHVCAADLVHIRRGSLLHDIGKLGVPDAVLMKPGKLTIEEWDLMRQHPTHAYEMLSSVEYIKPALDIPYCHHEKWDGTGYPRGLKGEQIPLVARIFAIVDVWDALRSDRPYREAWTYETVREYIIEQSGKQFEPRIVEVFLNMLDESPELY